MIKRLLLAAGLLLGCTQAHAAFQFSDIACETTTTTGTGTLNLAGAAVGYLGLIASGITSGSTVPYQITSSDQKFETGIGTLTDASPDTLARTSVKASSDGMATALTLPAGTHTVCIGPIASIFPNGGTGTAWNPTADATADLGTTALSWNNLFLDTGAVINFENGDVLITMSANALAFSGVTGDYTFDDSIDPAADATSDLGTAALSWNNLFLDTGAVINFENGDVTITHSANALAFAGVTGDYTFDDSVFVTGTVDASDDVDAADDVIVGDDITMSSSSPQISMTDTDTGADNLVTASSNNGSINLSADANAEVASSRVGFFVDGVEQWQVNPTALGPIADDTENIGTTSLGVLGMYLGASGIIEFNGDTGTTLADNGAARLMVEGEDINNLQSSAAAPTTPTPVEGDTWIDDDTGTEYVYYTDGDTSQWVEMGPVGSGYLLGKKTVWIPAGSMKSRVTSGAAAADYDSGSQDNTIAVFDFDGAADEFVQFHIAMPKSWDEGTVTFQPLWTCTGCTAAETVVFSMVCGAVSNDDALNVTLGTQQDSSDAVLAAGDQHTGPESAAITCAGTPAESDYLIFSVFRDVSSDNMNEDARLLGVKLFYMENNSNDG